jgi:deoxyribodipyrimidine photolyase-related protein
MSIVVIFPVHLFENSDLLNIKDTKKYIIEDPVYFTKYNTHKLKLILHRASMKQYADKYNLTYIDFDKANDFYKNNKKTIICYDPVDHDILNKLKKYSKVDLFETPGFITTYEDLKEFHDKYQGKRFIHDSQFYRWQRDRLNILKNDKLSFDSENRKPFVKNQEDVLVIKNNKSKYVIEAKKYIEKHFSKNFGSADNFFYPIDHQEAKDWLEDFIKHRFKLFGDYEDAISSKVQFGFHSVLSPILNIGLLTDQDVIDEVLKVQHKIPINSFEGFIRQIIGWKSTMRYFYEFYYEKQFGMNKLNHKRKLTSHFWEGTTTIPIIDDTIKKLDKIGYLHHIDRLMVMGNFMLLCEIDPNEVFEWFMLTVDAYQWVMVPNIFGMSQYADGGLLMTRPYFSSSNYILKMSNYKKGPWCEIWDALYYRFIHKNYDMLKKIYATARNVYHWDKKSKKEQDALLETADKYLKSLN